MARRFKARQSEFAVDVAKRRGDGSMGSGGEAEPDSVTLVGVGILAE